MWELGYEGNMQRYGFATAQMPPNARVLDAGCGTGYGSSHLANHGAEQVVAVDISPEALELARQHFSHPRVIWVQDDCHSLQRAAEHGPFDMVCNLENIEHLREPERFLLRVTQLIRPQGVFVTSTPNRIFANRIRGESADAAPRNPHHFREYTGDEFRVLLGKYFDEVTLAFQTYTQEARSILYLEPAMSLIWYNPAMRIGRWLQRVIRGRPIPRRFEDMLPRRKLEVTAVDPGPDLSLVYLAACRWPRSRSATG
jgi:SAM-dependent methyltransferase